LLVAFEFPTEATDAMRRAFMLALNRVEEENDPAAIHWSVTGRRVRGRAAFAGRPFH